MPLRSAVIAHYAPGRIKPGRPSHIAVRHGRHGWTIAWRPAANATAQQLTIRFIDGEQVLMRVTGRARRVALARSLDHGGQPTAIEIVGYRGTIGGRTGSAFTPLVRHRRHR
jgi:hypothetical protein